VALINRVAALAATGVQRLAAFTDVPSGGNPSGVVLDASSIAGDSTAMLAVAADVGDSETVFVTDGPVTAGRRVYTVRYFSPEVEVPFCGHATIALAVAIGDRLGAGPLTLHTAAGQVNVDVAMTVARWRATLTSPPPSHDRMPSPELEALLTCFGWTDDVLDPRTLPGVAYAGARHAIVPLRDRATLAEMAYDFARLRDLCIRHGWVTVHLAFAETLSLHHVRAPFPYGGVVEDPATGAGAAAYAAYLRDTGRIAAPAELTIRQGVDMGRPSTIYAALDATGPVRITGHAVPIPRRDRAAHRVCRRPRRMSSR
jgi:PhzF family phenazine biosynthesis protein